MDETPTFEREKDARAWLLPRVIDSAAAPFLGILSEDAALALREYLEDSAATHGFLRILAHRAVRSLAKPVPEELEKQAEAARLRGKETPPGATKVKQKKREPAIEGKPTLTRADYEDRTLKVVKPLAKQIAARAGRAAEKAYVDDLIGKAWLIAVEIEPTWNGTKGAYDTYLYECARRKLIDEARLHRNLRERPASSAFANYVSEDDVEGSGPMEAFEHAVHMAAGSWVLGFMSQPSAPQDELLARAIDLDALRAAVLALDESEQEIIGLVYVEDLSVDAAGKKLGLSEGTGRRLHERAIKSLRKILSAKSNVRKIGRR